MGVENGPEHIVGNHPGDVNLCSLIKANTKFRNISIDTVCSDYEDGRHRPALLEKKYPAVKNLSLFLSQKQDIEEKVFEASNSGNFVLSLGGDHSIAFGTVSGMKKKHPNLAVVWVDAHADINTLASTNSGNLHGCAASFLLGLNEDTDFGNPMMKEKLDASQLGYIGLRDVEQCEKTILSKLHIHPNAVASAIDVEKHGILSSLRKVLHSIDPSNCRPIHLSFDIDALDPLEAPATGTPVPAGLSLREGIIICEELYNTGRLVSMDLVEVNISIAQNQQEAERTKSAAQALILSALGQKYL
ncbi:Arginase [Mitosporidium daphniae]|uniref:Arginase n=1 Tax=Mitosporidium daphniae TaxID=1485682 RepID=A0A098VRA8_9MICR|nr:uncharacterized protein DI09_7p500 [Mitosporidium daphniae]KGG50271.1 hypothetical protein DI09_7p500 [Mitosporidium daphniae]|eukprot:XP_013236698.1 uncharacterized protein DI09_7p500 [Mitosporidium daphniae]